MHKKQVKKLRIWGGVFFIVTFVALCCGLLFSNTAKADPANSNSTPANSYAVSFAADPEEGGDAVFCDIDGNPVSTPFQVTEFTFYWLEADFIVFNDMKTGGFYYAAPQPNAGYEFKGWDPEVTEEGAAITKDTTFTAKFEKEGPATHTVTFVADPAAGGTITIDGKAATTVTVPSGTWYGATGVFFMLGDDDIYKATPANGYKFIGWNPSTSGTVTDNMTVTAKFEQEAPAKYSISKSTSPGVASISAKVEGSEVSEAEEGTAVSVSATAAEGYEIQSITITPEDESIEPTVVEGDSGDFKMPGSNVTITATSEQKPVTTYTVTFDSQGGSVVPSQTVNHGEKVKEPTPTPTKTGFDFAGWYKEASCTNLWNFDTDTVTQNTTLYANWTRSSYTVSFDSQGGSVVPSQTVNHGEKVKEPSPAPTKTGFDFAGWYKEASCTNPWNFDTDTVTSATTLYANWSAQIVPIDVPKAVEGLKYNGEEQTGVPDGTGYTITGNVATEIGFYNATATLKDGYCWKDGSTEPAIIPWSIAKGIQKIAKPEIKSFSFTDVEIDALEPGHGNTLYAISETNTAPASGWQLSTKFENLKDNTTYYIFGKYIGDDNYEEAVSAGTEFTTMSYEKAFNNYKLEVYENLDLLSKEGDSEIVLQILQKAHDDIMALTYNPELTLEQNIARIDDINDQAEKDVVAQRPKDFEIFKTEKKQQVSNIKQEGDSAEVDTIIKDTNDKIDALEYDSSKTPKVNQSIVNTYVNETETNVYNDRVDNFNAQKEADVATLEKLKDPSDSAETSQAIEDVITDIKSATYDSSKTPKENKTTLDSVVEETENGLKVIRGSEFDTFKANAISEIENLAKEGDSDEVKALIANARAKVESMEYDKTINLESNKKAVQEVVDQLKSDVEKQRAEDEKKKQEESQGSGTESASAQTGDMTYVVVGSLMLCALGAGVLAIRKRREF